MNEFLRIAMKNPALALWVMVFGGTWLITVCAFMVVCQLNSLSPYPYRAEYLCILNRFFATYNEGQVISPSLASAWRPCTANWVTARTPTLFQVSQEMVLSC